MFESAISTNFDAVSILRCGRFDESLHLLKSVLSVVQQAVAFHESSQEESGPQGVILSVPVEGDGHEDERLPKFTPSLSGSCSNLFNRAFIFDGNESLANTDENASLCASVGLYNMALTLHLKGLTTEGPSCLIKASGLYRKVYTILQTLEPQPTDSVSSLLLATVLNLIACQGELQGHQSAQPWMQVYMHVYAWATQSSHAAVSQQPEERSIFAASSIFFSSQNLCTAAAALSPPIVYHQVRHLGVCVALPPYL